MEGLRAKETYQPGESISGLADISGLMTVTKMFALWEADWYSGE